MTPSEHGPIDPTNFLVRGSLVRGSVVGNAAKATKILAISMVNGFPRPMQPSARPVKAF